MLLTELYKARQFMKNEFSSRLINRLAQYHTILRDFSKKNIKNITSILIAQILKIDETQVRKDIQCIKCKGKCKVGYSVSQLKTCIENILDCKTLKKACVIGAGNLGVALTKYAKFKEFGLEIVAIYDSSPLKINTQVGTLKISDISSLSLPDAQMPVAILTVPNNVAQNVCNIVVEAGFKYIWNFAPTILSVPDDVEVWHENLIGSFLAFCANSKYSKI